MYDADDFSYLDQTENLELSSFGLKNFRVFKEYIDFKIKSLNILTGTNNSGKSSLIKALLLMKSNQSKLNKSFAGYSVLNYFGGEHLLGNHQYVKNISDKPTSFYFTFFHDYQYTIDLSPEGIIVNDYCIRRADKPVISLASGKIKFDFLNLIEYFKKRVSIVPFEDKSKLNNFISKLEELSKKGYHSAFFDLNALSYKHDVENNIIEERAEELELKYKALEQKGILSGSLDLDCSNLKNIVCTVLSEDEFNYDWFIVLIYVFNKITGIELTAKEINGLVPFKENPATEGVLDIISLVNIIYIPTIKEHLKRSYSTDEKSMIYKLISNQTLGKLNVYDIKRLSHNIDTKPKLLRKIDTYTDVYKFAEKWLKEFEIGEKLSFGYETETDTFYIKIDDKFLPEYGFGYSQVLYIIIALFNIISIDRSKAVLKFPYTFIIEEPETGLHPAFQSKMAEMIVDAQKTFKVNFIIETHSEYFIRKLQLLTAEETISPDDAVIYYFNNPKKLTAEDELVKEITIDKYGGLSDSFGKGFYDEATTLKFDLIDLNKKQQK